MSLKDSFQNLHEYLEARIELTKIQVLEKISLLTSSVLTTLILIFLAFFFLLFASIAASLIVGEQLGEWYWGFLIVACFYALLAIVLYAFRRKIILNPILNTIIDVMFREDDEEDKKTDV